MSIIPELARSMNYVNRYLYGLIVNTEFPATTIVPLQPSNSGYLPRESGDQILMDHPRLPEPFYYNFFNLGEVMVHRLGEFTYECWNQPYGGHFHLMTHPGLFSIGIHEWYLGDFGYSSSDVRYKIIVKRPVEKNNDNSVFTSETVLVGNQKAQIFLSTGDMFKLEYAPVLGPDMPIVRDELFTSVDDDIRVKFAFSNLSTPFNNTFLVYGASNQRPVTDSLQIHPATSLMITRLSKNNDYVPTYFASISD
jgi:hypothetical protein